MFAGFTTKTAPEEALRRRRDFLLTGAGIAIAETARLLERAGARARVHPSAVTYDVGAT